MSTSRPLPERIGPLPAIAPSLLAADFSQLGREVRQLESAGARILHLDVMDGHFVPNISFGVPIVEAVRRTTDLLLDVHLMISDPARYVEAFREAGADAITIHIEAAPDPIEILDRIRSLGAYAGLSLSPPTPVDSVAPFLNYCDLVLVMSVMPGFGGQTFQPEVLPKIRYLRQRLGEDRLVSVDGGVNGTTVAPCAQAGANLLVVGTGLLGHSDYRRRFAELLEAARSSCAQRVEPWCKSS